MSGADERYRLDVPGRARIEHLHRYAACRDAVCGLSVLDLACGEGYGARLLSGSAARVTGLDRDEDVIRAASSRYGALPGVAFVVGDATALPFAAASFDAVVCFEAIEHVEAQTLVLDEIRRILRPDGFLVISTPDRELHGLRQEGPNPHHVHELTRREFVAILSDRFAKVALYGQGAWSASLLLPEALPDAAAEWVHASTVADEVDVSSGVSEAHRAEFHIAVCSDGAAPLLRDGCLADSTYSIADEDRLLERRAAFLNGRLERLHVQVDSLHREVANRDLALARVQAALAARDADAQRREEELASEWRSLNAVLQQKEAALLRSVNVAADQHAEIERLHGEVAARDRLIARQIPEAAAGRTGELEGLALLRSQYKDALNVGERARARAEAAEAALAKSRAELDALRGDAEAGHRRIENLESQLAMSRPEREALKDRLATLESEMANLRATCERLDADVMMARDRAGRASAAEARMKTRMLGQLDRFRELTLQAQRIELELSRARWSAAVARTLATRARFVLGAAQNEIGRLASIVAGLRASRSWRLTWVLRRVYRWMRLGSLTESRKLELSEAQASRPRDPIAQVAPVEVASDRSVVPRRHAARECIESAAPYGVVAGDASRTSESAARDIVGALDSGARQAGLAGLFFELTLREGSIDGMEILRAWRALPDTGLEYGLVIAGSWSISESDVVMALAALSDVFADHRYVRVGAKPVVLLAQRAGDQLPDAARLRALIGRAGLPAIHLRRSLAPGTGEAWKRDFDGAFVYPPHSFGDPSGLDGEVSFAALVERDRLEDAAPGIWPGVCSPLAWIRAADAADSRASLQDVVMYQNWLVDVLIRVRDRTSGSESVRVPILVNGWGAASGAAPDVDDALRDATSMAQWRARWIGTRRAPDAPRTVAVIVHAFYPDLLADIVARLDAVRCGMHIYSTCALDRKSEVRAILARGRHPYLLEAVPNRGRDMLPFLGQLQRVLEDGHAYVLKVHTKRSTHRRDGDRWRTDLLDALLDPGALDAALDQFFATPSLGLLCPASHLYRMPPPGHADARLLRGAARVGVAPEALAGFDFPAGGMFVARSLALRPLLALGYETGDFEEESGQLDATMAHALERMIAAGVASMRLDIAAMPTGRG